MNELKTKTTSTGMDDENNHDNLVNLKVIDEINELLFKNESLFFSLLWI
jgi:hypothetical protein